MNIDDHRLPFPEEVKQAAARFQQGDVIRDPPLAYHTAGLYPLWTLSQSAARDHSITLVDLDEPGFDFAVITTQTCDIVEEDTGDPRKPWIQVSPVYAIENVSPTLKASVEAFANSDFVRLNGSTFSEEFYVADLRISLPLEKSLLVGRDPIPGFLCEEDVVAFAGHCAAYLNRPAVPSIVHVRVVKHMKRYFERIGKLRLSFAEADVRGLRLKIATEGPNTVVQLVVLLGQNTAEHRATANRALGRWWDAAKKNAEDAPIVFLGNRYVTLAEISAEEYLATIPLRLDLIIRT